MLFINKYLQNFFFPIKVCMFAKTHKIIISKTNRRKK